jgi:hypothetical protein
MTGITMKMRMMKNNKKMWRWGWWLPGWWWITMGMLVRMKKRIRMILRMMNNSIMMKMWADAGDLRDPSAVHGAGGGPVHQARTSSGHRQGKTTNSPYSPCRAWST